MWSDLAERILQDTDTQQLIAQYVSSCSIVIASFIAASLAGKKDRTEIKHKKQYILALLETFKNSGITLSQMTLQSDAFELDIYRTFFIESGAIVMKMIGEEFKYFITSFHQYSLSDIQSLEVVYRSALEKTNEFRIKNLSSDSRKAFIESIDAILEIISDIILVQRKFSKPIPIRNILIFFYGLELRLKKLRVFKTK